MKLLADEPAALRIGADEILPYDHELAAAADSAGVRVSGRGRLQNLVSTRPR